METGESELIFMRQLVGKVLVMLMDSHSFKKPQGKIDLSYDRKGIEAIS